MSELKVYHHELRHNEYEEFYLKSEADKVIALLTDKANYNEYAYKLKSEELADTCRFYEDELRHHKYKRCLAMAERCKYRMYYLAAVVEQEASKIIPLKAQIQRYEKRERRMYYWKNRWLELAKKFKDKEAK
jgi:hypothetical protein